MSYEQRRKALPIAANVELLRRIDIAKSLIHEAHMLSLEEAKKCAPRLWAARKNVGTILSIVGLIVGLIIVVIGGIITESFNGLRSFNVIGITLMFSSFIVGSTLQDRLASSRYRLFKKRWQPIEQRWREIGLNVPGDYSIRGIALNIVEVHPYYGWTMPEYTKSSTDENLDNYLHLVKEKLLTHIEMSL